MWTFSDLKSLIILTMKNQDRVEIVVKTITLIG